MHSRVAKWVSLGAGGAASQYHANGSVYVLSSVLPRIRGETV